MLRKSSKIEWIVKALIKRNQNFLSGNYQESLRIASEEEEEKLKVIVDDSPPDDTESVCDKANEWFSGEEQSKT